MIQDSMVHCACGHTNNAHALNFGKTRKRCLIDGCRCVLFERCACGRATPMGRDSAHVEEQPEST